MIPRVSISYIQCSAIEMLQQVRKYYGKGGTLKKSTLKVLFYSLYAKKMQLVLDWQFKIFIYPYFHSTNLLVWHLNWTALHSTLSDHLYGAEHVKVLLYSYPPEMS